MKIINRLKTNIKLTDGRDIFIVYLITLVWLSSLFCTSVYYYIIKDPQPHRVIQMKEGIPTKKPTLDIKDYPLQES